MRTLKDLLPKKRLVKNTQKKTVPDEQSILYVAKKVLTEEYGLRGGENIIPILYKENILYLSSRSSLWGNEIWLERDRLRIRMNEFLGEEVVREIKLKRE